MFDWYDLNARHAAAFIWVAAPLVYALFKASDVRETLVSLLKILFRLTLFIPILGLLATVAVLITSAVIVGRIWGLWETLPIVTATIWFLTSGFSLFDHLKPNREDNAFWKTAKAILGPSAIITALSGIAIFPFFWELVLIPVSTIIYIYTLRNDNERTATVANVLLGILGMFLVFLGVWDLVENPATWKSLTQSIVLPIWLTIGALPYIQVSDHHARN